MSMPAARTAVNALPVVRKWNCLGCGVPREVTAVSRFTIVRSAEPSTDEIGPNAAAGCLSSLAVRLAKLTSPAKASVMSGEAALGLAAGLGEELAHARVGAGCVTGAAAHPARARTSGRTASCRRVSTATGYARPRRQHVVFAARHQRKAPCGRLTSQ